jgi:hypothetical protein
MRYVVSLVTLLVTVANAQVVQAQGNLTVDVSGIPGSGQTTWTFSGSYTVGDVSQLADNYSLLGILSGRLDDNINNFTHESGELTGGIGVEAIPSTFNLLDLPLLSSTAQISGSQSGVHLLDGIFLDSDDPITGDDFAWYAEGAFQDGETLTFSGTATIVLDINLFLAEGEMFRSVSSIADLTTNNPADFTMNLTEESGDPSAQIEGIEDTVAVLESGGAINTGLAASLTAKLGAATNRLDDQPRAAVEILMAFIQQVTALVRAGGLNSADGEILITAAENVIARIQPM